MRKTKTKAPPSMIPVVVNNLQRPPSRCISLLGATSGEAKFALHELFVDDRGVLCAASVNRDGTESCNPCAILNTHSDLDSLLAYLRQVRPLIGIDTPYYLLKNPHLATPTPAR